MNTRDASRRFAAILVNLTVATTLVPAVRAQDAALLDDFRAAHDAYDQKEYKKSIELYIKVYNGTKNGDRVRAISAYNISCSLGLDGGSADEIFKWLGRAAEAGFGETLDNPQQPSDLELIKTDTDLERVRSDARFAKVIESVTKNRTAAEEAKKNAPKEIEEPLYYIPEKLDKTKPAPLVILCHGGQGNKKEFLESWKDAAAEAGVCLVSLNGGEYVAPGRFGWYRGDVTNLIGALPKIEKRLRAAIDAAKVKYNIDPERVAVAGFSQGGGVALFAGLQYKSFIRGAVAVGAAYPTDELDNLLKATAFDGAQIYQIAGEKDENWGAAQRDLDPLLKKAKVRSEVKMLPIGHYMNGIPKELLVESLKFATRREGAESRATK